MRGLGSRKYNTNKFIVIPIFILYNRGKIIYIKREIYIVNELSAKVLIGINIIKLEGILIDTRKDKA